MGYLVEDNTADVENLVVLLVESKFSHSGDAYLFVFSRGEVDFRLLLNHRIY